jgi:putative transposase
LGKGNAMKRNSMRPTAGASRLVGEAWEEVGASFERFCLTAGIATLTQMLEADVTQLCGPRHGRDPGRSGHRWGRTPGRLEFHGGTVPIERPRVRSRDGGEMALPSWEAAVAEGWLGRWAMNLMLINVSTRKFGRAVRLPDGDIPASRGDGRSKSAVSRRFVELSAERMAAWMASDLSQLDLLAIQIDGLHIEEELVLVAAVGIDAAGAKHPLGVIEGATENAATVQALLDNLVGRGLDPTICRLFIVDGAKALTKAIRRTFGQHTPRSSAVRSIRRATSWSGCRSICTPACAKRCAKPGNWMMRRRLGGWSRTWPGGWNARPPAPRRASWKEWTRC